MRVNDFFEKVYVISLDRRVDRRINFEYSAKNLDLEFEFYNAFDGTTLNQDFIYNGKQIQIGRNHYYKNGFDSYSKGQVGCLLSHLEVLKKAKSENLQNVLILEDDTKFTNNFEQKFENFTQKFEIKNWDMLYFGGSLVEVECQFENFIKINSCHTTHSYSVTNKVFDFLIDNIEENLYNMPIDVIYSKLHSKIETYMTLPFLTYQEEGFSDIQNSYVDYVSTKEHL